MTIELSKTEAEAFLEVAEDLDQTLGNRGCNDFTLDDTPENRQFIDQLEAYNFNVPIEQVKDHPDYEPPRGHNGKLYTQDSTIFGYVIAKMRAAMEAKP